MAVEAIGREMAGVYLRLAEAAAAVRYRQRNYLDGRGAGSLFGPATALTAVHPWALADFGAGAWADYRPDPAGPAAGRAARRAPAAGRGRAAGTSGGEVRRARPPADQRARVRRRGTIAAAGAHPAARHGHPAGHGAVRARRPGGAGPVPQRVPAAARAAAGGHSRGSPRWGRGQPGRDRGPADHADQPRRGGHPDPADQRLRLGGDLQRGHHGGHGALPRPGAAGFPAGIGDRAAELLGGWPATGPGTACTSSPPSIPGSTCPAASTWPGSPRWAPP